MLTWIDDDQTPLPPATQALGPGSDAPGLVAVGGRPSPRRLEEAYRQGIFPWYSEGQPTLWWSPDPRMVLPVAGLKIAHSLAKTLRRFARSPDCEVRVDTAFREVIEACAGMPRAGQQGTWILPEMVEAYCAWQRLGRVHSVETWIDGRLAGGLYGVAIGGMFFGESMFAHRSDASKIALCALICLCRAHGVALIDCQQNTRHLASLGAREMPRRDFLAHVARVLDEPGIRDWTYDRSLWAQLLDDAPGTQEPAA